MAEHTRNIDGLLNNLLVLQSEIVDIARLPEKEELVQEREKYRAEIIGRFDDLLAACEAVRGIVRFRTGAGNICPLCGQPEMHTPLCAFRRVTSAIAKAKARGNQ